jgi:hypothetical protein
VIYIADNREKSKKSRFPQRTQYPENWFKDRVFEPYLAQVAEQRERDSHAQAAIAARQALRLETIAHWNSVAEGAGDRLAKAMGEKRFDPFIGTTVTKEPDGSHLIDFHKADQHRSTCDLLHSDTIAKILGTPVRLTDDAKRASDARWAAQRAAKAKT